MSTLKEKSQKKFEAMFEKINSGSPKYFVGDWDKRQEFKLESGVIFSLPVDCKAISLRYLIIEEGDDFYRCLRVGTGEISEKTKDVFIDSFRVVECNNVISVEKKHLKDVVGKEKINTETLLNVVECYNSMASKHLDIQNLTAELFSSFVSGELNHSSADRFFISETLSHRALTRLYDNKRGEFPITRPYQGVGCKAPVIGYNGQPVEGLYVCVRGTRMAVIWESEDNPPECILWGSEEGFLELVKWEMIKPGLYMHAFIPPGVQWAIMMDIGVGNEVEIRISPFCSEPENFSEALFSIKMHCLVHWVDQEKKVQNASIFSDYLGGYLDVFPREKDMESRTIALLLALFSDFLGLSSLEVFQRFEKSFSDIPKGQYFSEFLEELLIWREKGVWDDRKIVLLAAFVLEHAKNKYGAHYTRSNSPEVIEDMFDKYIDEIF